MPSPKRYSLAARASPSRLEQAASASDAPTRELVRAARQSPPRGCQATARRREVLSFETDDGILLTPFDQGIGKGFARPKQTWHDAPESDLAVLAAAYAFGVANAHLYNDGNKRTALVTMPIVLGLNGKDLDGTATILPSGQHAQHGAHERAVSGLPKQAGGHVGARQGGKQGTRGDVGADAKGAGGRAVGERGRPNNGPG